MASASGLEFVKGSIQTLERNKRWAEQAINQLDEQQLRTSLHAETNSIFVIMKHVAGNLKSRWTDFLTTDGEKEWRNRDQEFVDSFAGIEEAVSYWNEGWTCLFDSLRSLTEDDLEKTVEIRGEPHSVPLAIQRSMTHTTYHVGQIMLMARVLADREWQTITIPKGGSAAYNTQVWGKNHFHGDS